MYLLNRFLKVLYCVGFVVLFFYVPRVQAAKLEFSPTSGGQPINSTFAVQVQVDTGGVDTTSADALIQFNNTLLSVDSVSYGSFYKTVLHSESNGVLSISGMVDPGGVANGTGMLATVNFKALTNGTAQLTFSCTADRTDDSNISKNDQDSTDIIDCSSLSAASFTLGTTDVTTAPTVSSSTIVPTASGGSSTEIPRAGNFEFTAVFPKITLGVIFLLVGLIPLLI